ncbi:MAG TPA: response regulator transcription factor [Syntrophomonas sp.]|nr:response regulator transcription factor [Syntrophomonas sp.]
MKVLVVEDDRSISDLIRMNLEIAGYEVRQAYDGREALDFLDREVFHMVILDVMLPEMSGFDILQEMKRRGLPVIFLTARDQLSDKVRALNLGADDYIVKPFAAVELIARMAAVLRRYRSQPRIVFRDLEICMDERVVRKAGQEVYLTHKEFELLALFLQNQAVALSREQILEHVWGYDYVGETRTVDMHVQRLRSKLGLQDEIVTVYKTGYRFDSPKSE